MSSSNELGGNCGTTNCNPKESGSRKSGYSFNGGKIELQLLIIECRGTDFKKIRRDIGIRINELF